jgi:hypothetical protein
VPRTIWWDQIRAGLNPHLARNLVNTMKIEALSGDDPTDLADTPDELPVIALLKRMARNEEVSFEEAHEVTEELDSVIIGDPDHCKKKMDVYRRIGADRLMCLMQYGRIAHGDVVRSTRLAGEHLLPHFADRVAAAAV